MFPLVRNIIFANLTREPDDCRVGRELRLDQIRGLAEIDALPAGDDGGGEAVAEDVYGSPCHVEDRVDAEDHGDAFGGDAERRYRAGESKNLCKR